MGFNYCILIITSLLAFVIHCNHQALGEKLKEGKRRSPYSLTLCGDDFIKAYLQVCKLRGQNNRARRSLEQDLQKISSVTKHILNPTEANQFLHPLGRYRRQAGGFDDPKEECCLETCTFAEIAEYKC